MYPGASISVADDGTINVVSEEPQALIRASYYAPAGGSWRNFSPPIGYPFTSPMAYSKVYLPPEETVCLLNARLESGLLSEVSDWVKSGLSYLQIQKLIIGRFGFDPTIAGVAFLIGVKYYEVIDWIDTTALTKAVNNSTKKQISITRATVNGNPMNVYQAWNDYYVNPDPYSNFKPTWHKGEYDL